ncbi:hypothetical protein SLS58_005956 [Diplodia intermedia]|uniref:HIT domain-containing protein n=1 Tax=Diplodia intermedia TaxID=856260 RepID=A0ABR3TPN0_9PEZI
MKRLRQIFDVVCRVARYLAGLEWTERKQDVCRFCDSANFRNIVYEDADVLAFENARLAGRHHWLLIPKKHMRDIEALTVEHIPLRNCSSGLVWSRR